MLGPVSPLFVSSDVPRAVSFYRDALGFEVRLAVPPEAPFLAIVGRDAAQLLLKDPRGSDDEPLDPRPNATLHPQAPWDAFVHVADPDALAAELAARSLLDAPTVHDRDDGLRGFELRDPDGHVLFFGRPIPRP